MFPSILLISQSAFACRELTPPFAVDTAVELGALLPRQTLAFQTMSSRSVPVGRRYLCTPLNTVLSTVAQTLASPDNSPYVYASSLYLPDFISLGKLSVWTVYRFCY